jgi:integrase
MTIQGTATTSREVRAWYRCGTQFYGGTVSRSRERVAEGVYREVGVRGTRYVVRWRASDGQQRTKVFPRLQEAREFRSAAMANRQEEGERAAGKGITLGAVADTYLAQHPHWRESTRSTQVARLTAIRENLGEMPVQVVKTSDIKRYLSKLHKEGRTRKTQEATRALLRAVFQCAVDDGLITRNPVDAVKAIRDDRTAEERDARLTDAQLDAIRKHLPTDEWRGFLTFILGTGLRGGEAAGLTWDRVDFLHKRVRIDRQLVSGNYGEPEFGPPKTKNSTRWVPMRPGISEVLQAQQEAHPVTPAGLVWVTETNAPMGRAVRSNAWRSAAEGLDLPPAVRGWHAIRHTTGSRLLDSGAPITAIAAMLGHTVEELTGTYAHAELDYTEALAAIPMWEISTAQ